MLRDYDTAVSCNPVASSWMGNAIVAALTLAAQASGSVSAPTGRVGTGSG